VKTLLPPSIPNDDLIAKCSPRGAGRGGNVVWTGYFARGQVHVEGREPAPSTVRVDDIRMAYKMEHWTSRKNYYRTIDEIIVTNLFCGRGQGWDIIVCGTIMHHEKHKTDAQIEAEKLLDGAM
jgi:hypothetical protein